MELTGKVALITGGRRIGAAVAERLAGRGVDVALSYNRSGAEAEKAADRVRGAGRAASVAQADLTRPSEVERLVEGTAARFGRLDILISMASIYRHTAFDALTEEDWTATLDVDLSAAWRLARAAVPRLRAAGGGRIVHFSDWIAASGRPRYTGYLPYYVAKRAVMGLTEALALELAADGILVNTIAPGPIVPPSDLEPDEIEAVERATPVGRWGGPEAIADTVVGVLQSDFITGETIRVDGGRHLR
ncbi:MAG: SDR family NAD(P)-dependent oxidoreductase [Acidobacteria bacterium]|nr:SDR family NAD(P)-dependent oxidoreductase [Acidobacteriota bacterium]